MHEVARRNGGPLGSPTNSPTALTHDLFERLAAQRNPVRDDEHLMALASTLAIRVVADDQKRRMRAKRGAGNRGEAIDASVPSDGTEQPDHGGRDAIRAALSRFSESHPRAAEIASLRLLFDLTNAQVADAVGVSIPTVERDWRFARAWLADDLTQRGYGPDAD